MNAYLYDGSFYGLLTAYFYAWNDNDIYTIAKEAAYTSDLLSRPVHIVTQTDKAQRIIHSVQQNLSAYTMKNLYLIYLSELTECDLLGLTYLRLCFSKGNGINHAKQHPVIRQVDAIHRKVMHEYDHMKGFLRFQKINDQIFFARFAPDHNQLPLLMHHLTERFSDQKMIVHDEKRNCAMLYNLQERVIIPFTKEDAAHILADCQDDTIDLFRRYFQTINIPERENLRQQAGYMPHRYRKYMPETE